MHATALIETILRYRLDAVALVAVTALACRLCCGYVRRRHAAAEFALSTCWMLVSLAVVGALLTEWLSAVFEVPESVRTAGLFTVRVLAFTGVGSVIAVLLASATLVARMRAEIREHAETTRQLQAAKTAADDANRAKSNFLAVMSHEIRTPLNAVMGFANLLSETKLDEAQRGYLATITGEGGRLTSLINDILDLSKIEEGRLALERLPFAPSETAHEVLRLLGPRAQEKKIDLRFEAQLAGPLLIAGDPLRFRQVILNLVDNALKFTPHGSVTLFLNWREPGDGEAHGHLRVRVRDTGIGISPEKQKSLFQMFMQADASTTRRYGGTGLGLAICHRLVGLMGGAIAVTSQPGQGAEFDFTIPAAVVALPEEEASTILEPATTSVHRPRVLVVDDMETNRFLLEVFLTRNGFDPELAASGEEAIRLAAAKRYDAILMDLHMPDLDGYATTQRLRAAEPPGTHTPIIALTASIAKDTRQKCLAAGMDEHLTKPLDLRKFKTLLQNYVAAAKAPTPSAPLAQPSTGAPA
ncbi:MAG: response regulator [Verrucomicrobia bacterium]|nr:response regulator [Verrucomicrobiota bacterium]